MCLQTSTREYAIANSNQIISARVSLNCAGFIDHGGSVSVPEGVSNCVTGQAGFQTVFRETKSVCPPVHRNKGM